MKYLYLIILFLVATPCFATDSAPRYAVAKMPTPVLNVPDFPAVFGGKDGRSLQRDASGLIRAVEYVALPGTVFTIEADLAQGTQNVYRVTTADYPYPTKTGYYIDSRFVSVSQEKPAERNRKLPPSQDIIERMLAAQGFPYVWGGNVRSGIHPLLSLFPPAGGSPDGQTVAAWQLRGLDCSGLLYEATDGFTPRNTSSLLTYGEPVAIAGKTIEQIIARVEPLDLIVWQGHVIIVVDRERTIESCLNCGGTASGVVVRPIRQTLAGILKGRSAADDYAEAAKRGKKAFVIRRWYPH